HRLQRLVGCFSRLRIYRYGMRKRTVLAETACPTTAASLRRDAGCLGFPASGRTVACTPESLPHAQAFLQRAGSRQAPQLQLLPHTHRCAPLRRSTLLTPPTRHFSCLIVWPQSNAKQLGENPRMPSVACWLIHFHAHDGLRADARQKRRLQRQLTRARLQMLLTYSLSSQRLSSGRGPSGPSRLQRIVMFSTRDLRAC